MLMPLDQSAQLTQQYIGMLEKTNQQLGLWTNPYAVIVAALAVLFTALTIVAVFIVWRQGSEYKKAFHESLKGYQNKLQDDLKQITKQITKEAQKSIEENIGSIIKKQEDELSGLTGDVRQKAEEIISELKAKRENVESSINSTILNSSGLIYPLTPNTSYLNNPELLHSSGYNPMILNWNTGNFCPNCGSQQAVGANYCSNCGTKL